jgi:hypothetical protein
MKKIKLTEDQLKNVINRVINEQGVGSSSARNRLNELLSMVLKSNSSGDQSAVKKYVRTALEILYIYQGDLRVEINDSKFSEMISDNE